MTHKTVMFAATLGLVALSATGLAIHSRTDVPNAEINIATAAPALPWISAQGNAAVKQIHEDMQADMVARMKTLTPGPIGAKPVEVALGS